jgi:RHS repeat-associated protein
MITMQSAGLSQKLIFDERELVYEYDPVGRLKAKTNGLGQTIHFEHNELNQLIRKVTEGAVSTYEYDIFDELAIGSGPDVNLTRLRDRFGRLVSETVNGRKTSFEYDVLGRRVGRTTPSGAVNVWSYDAAGRRNRVVTSGRSIVSERDSVGQEVVRRIGQIVTFSHHFDVLGRLTNQQVTASGDSLQCRSYSYRPDGNLASLEDQLAGTTAFEWDESGRVTAVQAANWTERYAYDEVGNQTQASWPSRHAGDLGAGERSYSGTRIIQAGKIRYEYDAHGRLVLKRKVRLSRKPDTWRFEWDEEDRLRAVVTPDGTVWRYQYDVLGRRIAKQRLAEDCQEIVEQVTFTWDDKILCEQTTHGEGYSNPVALTWDYEGLHPVAQTERILARDASQEVIDERFFAIVTNLVGAPIELVDEFGTLAWRTRSTVWGTTTWGATSSAYTPLRFPGQYFDPETGLHYNFHRHYDPESARYLSVDPLGLIAAPNPVAYVSNPLAEADPLGLAPCKPDGFTDLGGNRYQSPEGLIYGPGSAHGHRITHVMEHAAPDPSKTQHGVFKNPDQGDILKLIDEGWAKRGSPDPSDPARYVVPMGREVGTGGERNLRIVVIPGTTKIITAFPQA